jgi:phosphatidate phosphatase APP1
MAPVSEEDEKSPFFNERARLFLVDNERGRRPRVEVGGRKVTLGPTDPGGQTEGQILLPMSAGKAGDDLPARVRLSSRGRPVHGTVRLMGPAGVLVVSDIDDTIKISSVTDRQELLANTFFRPWRAVPGMANLYRWWGEQGAEFHYLSASPWQLQPPLSAFFKTDGFPTGIFHLRRFRLKDGAKTEFFGDPAEHKQRILKRLLREFPAREFVLVGDDGEKDPEIYGEIARRHPGRVKAIFIRGAAGSPDEKRYETAFQSLPADRWRVFSDPAEIMP